MHLKSWSSLCCALAILGLCLPPFLNGAPPRLMFQKQIPLKKERNTFRYTIQKGEYVYSILRSFEVPEKKLSSMAEKVKELNPQIENLDRVEPGATIFLPQDLRPEEPARVSARPSTEPQAPDREAVGQLKTTIQPGDSLVSLLRENANLPDRLIFDEYLNLFRELNPGISNINNLEVGQEVILPLPPGQAREFEAREEGRANATARAEATPAAEPEEAPKEPEPPKSPRITNKQATLAMLKKAGFRFAPGQELLYPYAKQGWLRINLEQMPLANTPWGSSIVFIPESVMPRIELEEMKAAELKVCRVSSSWDPAATFERLEDLSRRNVIFWGPGTPMILSFNDQVLEVSADIILIDSSGLERVTHLFRLNPSRPADVPPLVHGFLDNQRIKIHNLIQASSPSFSPASFPDPSDIYVPRIPVSNPWPEIKKLLMVDDTDLSLSDAGYQSVVRALKDEGLATSATRRFSFFQSPSLDITLSLSVIELSSDKGPTFLIGPGQADPYLVAQLNLMGYSCYAVTPSSVLPEQN